MGGVCGVSVGTGAVRIAYIADGRRVAAGTLRRRSAGRAVDVAHRVCDRRSNRFPGRIRTGRGDAAC